MKWFYIRIRDGEFVSSEYNSQIAKPAIRVHATSDKIELEAIVNEKQKQLIEDIVNKYGEKLSVVDVKLLTAIIMIMTFGKDKDNDIKVSFNNNKIDIIVNEKYLPKQMT